MDYYSDLKQAVLAQSEEKAAQWLQNSLESIASSDKPEQAYQIASAMARRKLGEEPFLVSEAWGANNDIICSHWNCADAARILMTLQLQQQSQQPVVELLHQVYALGDEYERAALLKGLMLLDPDTQWLTEAEDSCRTNSLILLSAMAMNNPYPARHFSVRAFNQMVLKSLFLGLNIANVDSLDSRLNAELSVMCADYIEERQAASRDYPPSIWLAICIADCSDYVLEPLAESVVDEDINRRYYAVVSLIRQKENLPASILDSIRKQLALEQNSELQAWLSQLADRAC